MWEHDGQLVMESLRFVKLFAKMFYQLINKISQVEMVDGARDLRLMRRQMVDGI